jgi:hypothetical protein
MTMRYVTICTGALLAAIAFQSTSAHALTMAECSAKYKDANAAGTLNGMKWNDFRKAQCGSDATAAPAPASAPAPAPTPKPAAAAPAPKPAPAPVATGNAVFPSTVDSKFSTQKPHLARLHTCSEQWQANKASGANGNLKWPVFYHECNMRLKGGA